MTPTRNSSSWTPQQWRAVAWYAQENDLVPALSAHPIIYFHVKATGEEIKGEISELVDLYKTNKREESKERARMRRQERVKR